MSEVVEVTPASCPACGVSWVQPGTMLRGWSSNPLAGGMGHRTWDLRGL